jgi:hypothetical protein
MFGRDEHHQRCFCLEGEMFSSARFARLGLLAVAVVFGSCMVILGHAAFSKSAGLKLDQRVAQEAPDAQSAYLAMNTPEKRH